MKIDRTALYHAVLEHWGADFQFGMVVEELAELTIAIQHMRRGRCGMGPVIEEMADVSIMLEQLQYLFEVDETRLSEMIDRKLERLRKRVGANANAECACASEDAIIDSIRGWEGSD